MQYGVPLLHKDDGFDRRSCGRIPRGWAGARGVERLDKRLLIQRIEHEQLRIVFVETWQLEKCIRCGCFLRLFVLLHHTTEWIGLKSACSARA